MTLYDSLEIVDQKVTPEGHLLVKARVSRTGIQEYLLSEFAQMDAPAELSELPGDSIVRLNRPAEEVFHPESLATISGAPVTDGHPPCFVNDENYTEYSKGSAIGDPAADGDFVTSELLVKDKALIEKINAGVKQVSLGYNLDVDWVEGLDERHGVFDGYQRNIRVNHIAIVPQGRGGPRVRIADEQPHKKESNNMPTRLIDGLSVEFSDQGAEVVDKLQAMIEDLRTEAAKAKQEALDATAKAETLEGEIAVKDAKIEELNSRDLDALVAARLAVIDEARKLSADLDPVGKSLHDIKVEAVRACDESFDLEDKSEDFVEGVFRALLTARPGKSAMDQAMVDAASKLGVKDARTAGLEALRRQTEIKIWDKGVK